MERIKNFFWMCSGADLTTLKRTPTETNKFVGIGGTIFFTAVLAFLASAYAIYTIFDSYLAAIFFGAIWGLMIFNLDRYIVSSIKNKGEFWHDFFVAAPRVVIAVFLAIVISKPLELKIFEKEINAELISMEQEIKGEQEVRLKNRFTPQINFHQNAINQLKAEVDEKTAQRDALALEAIKEADGTGGSGVKNIGPIYKAKKAEADKAQEELQALKGDRDAQIAFHQNAINELVAQEKGEIASLPREAYNGFAARLEALSRLSAKSEAISIASLFIIIMFICIETAPIIVKLIAIRGPYDFKLDAHEHAFAMNHKTRTNELFHDMKNKVKYYTETGTYRVKAEIEAEKEIIDHNIKERINNVKWKTS
jgi:hypothetical protein